MHMAFWTKPIRRSASTSFFCNRYFQKHRPVAPQRTAPIRLVGRPTSPGYVSRLAYDIGDIIKSGSVYTSLIRFGPRILIRSEIRPRINAYSASRLVSHGALSSDFGGKSPINACKFRRGRSRCAIGVYGGPIDLRRIAAPPECGYHQRYRRNSDRHPGADSTWETGYLLRATRLSDYMLRIGVTRMWRCSCSGGGFWIGVARMLGAIGLTYSL